MVTKCLLIYDWVLPFVVPVIKIHSYRLIMRTPVKFTLGNIFIGYLDKYLHRHLKTVKIMKVKERLGNSHQQRLERLTTQCSVVPWSGSWNRKINEKLVKPKSSPTLISKKTNQTL